MGFRALGFRVLGFRGLGFRASGLSLGHFQVGSYRYIIEALYTLNSPPVVSFNLGRAVSEFTKPKASDSLPTAEARTLSEPPPLPGGALRRCLGLRVLGV